MSAPVRSRWKPRLLALALALLLAFLAGEVAVRGLLGAPLTERLPIMMMKANPYRGWQMVPSLDHYTYQHRVHVNALGLRGPEVEPKVAGERRVLVLGDSLVYGQGVGDAETLPAALERTLRELDPVNRWSVVNAGHRSYDTPQELGLLEELGARIAPDVVVLCWYWNDANERGIQGTYERLKGRGPIAFDTASPMDGLDRWRWHGVQLVRRSAFVMWLHDVLSPKGEPFAPDYFDKGLARLERYLLRYRELCAAIGARPVFAVIPDAKVLVGERFTHDISGRAAELARRASLPVVELLPPLETLFERTGRLPVLPFDGHYDSTGNEAMGAHLARQLLALEPRPRSEVTR